MYPPEAWLLLPSSLHRVPPGLTVPSGAPVSRLPDRLVRHSSYKGGSALIRQLLCADLCAAGFHVIGQLALDFLQTLDATLLQTFLH